MASLKCAKCGYGIHYHDEPDGTEWIAFDMGTWKRLLSSDLEISAYEIETKTGWYSIWKCKECGTLHIFRAMDTELYKAFEPVDFTDTESYSNNKLECIAFEDVVWDQITESVGTGYDFEDRFGSVSRKYARIFNNSILVYGDSSLSFVIKKYKELSEIYNVE